MPRKYVMKAPQLVLQPYSTSTADRIHKAAEGLLAMVFSRDREILEREQKLKEKALETIQKIFEDRSSDHLVDMLESIVKETSQAVSKIVDLKKIEVMATGRGKASRKSGAAAG